MNIKLKSFTTIYWLIIIAASCLSVRASIFGLEALVADGKVPVLGIIMVVLVQATLLVAGSNMFGTRNLIYKGTYVLAASFSITFGISYFLVHAGLEEQIIKEQVADAKTRLSDNMERSRASLDEFQNTLENLVVHSNKQAKIEENDGGTCQDAKYTGQGPRTRLRAKDAEMLGSHAGEVAEVSKDLDILSEQLAGISGRDVAGLRQITNRTGDLIGSERLTDAQQWVSERISRRDHYDEDSGQYFLCQDDRLEFLGHIVTSVKLHVLEVPELHQSREGSGFKITASILYSLLALNPENITPYHWLAVLFTFLVEGIIWLMLYTLYQAKSPLQEHLNRLDKVNKISDYSTNSILEKIINSYSEELTCLQTNWKDTGSYYKVDVQHGTGGENLALYLESLGIAQKTDVWIRKIGAMLGHQHKYQRFQFDKLLMQDLLAYRAGQQAAEQC